MTNPAEIPSASPPSTPPETPKALTLDELRKRIDAAKTEEEHGQIAQEVIAKKSEANIDAPTLKNWALELQKLKTDTMQTIGEKAENAIDDVEHDKKVDRDLAILNARIQFLQELAKKAPEASESDIPTAESFLERNFSKGKDAVVKMLTSSKNATGVMMASVISKLPMSAISTFVDQITIFIAKQMKDVPFIGEYAKNFIATKEKKIVIRDISNLIKKANKPGQQPKIIFDEKVSDLELETINPEALKKTAAQLVVDCQKFKNLPEITITVADFANPSAFLNAKRMENATPEEKAKEAAIVKDITEKSSIPHLGSVTLNTSNEIGATKAADKWNINVDASQFKDGAAISGSQADGLKVVLATIKKADSLRMIDASKPTELAWKPVKEMRIPTNMTADMLGKMDELFEKPEIHTGITTLRIAKAADSPGVNIVKLETPTMLVADSNIPPVAFAQFSNTDLTNPTKKWEFKGGNWEPVAASIPTTPPAAPKP
ncbi:MAG: hypothetical protein KBD00_03560 [Candidatus Peribacteraceae bacterium]|nr:hypothetical protein [Candidatus Peribacteraceae bacterium]